MSAKNVDRHNRFRSIVDAVKYEKRISQIDEIED